MSSAQPSPRPADRSLQIQQRPQGDGIVVLLGGDLDLENITPLGPALSDAAASVSGPVVVDLSAVGFADSSTVNVFLQAYGAIGPRLRFAALSPFVERLFGLIGLQSALPVHDSVAEALAAPVPAPDSGRPS
ncbi:STAS domain-containing protein [Streptomyces sp. NPDC058374]|uniref:STAS domain-containing protein n=1 Tax=unclassified Streptomyces TaxID=2593676 RepID=UPI0036470D96